ncbi:MAG: hypothetical protein B0D92_01275 [Spirochaeta sp. LUC14_002_19_P3]|nr:MAG: hypothetical protein B0D92_01275 [Spirochaeta sp. LUC14_002_19_P3]
MSDFHEKIIDLIDSHKKISVRQKQYETAGNAFPPIEVLNELRYALRAIIKLLEQASYSHLSSDEDMDKFNASCQEASHAFRNAHHDLVDGSLIDFSMLMDNISAEYRLATVNILGQKRLEILEFINKVEESIAASRGDRTNIEPIYDEDIYGKWFDKILEYYKFVDQTALPEIIKEHEHLKQKELGENRKSRTNLIIGGIVGFLSGIAGTLLIGIFL